MCSCVTPTTGSQAEAPVVLLVELLLALFGRRFHQPVPPVHHAASLPVALVPGDAADVAEVPEVLHRVVFLQVGRDGLQAEHGEGVGAGPLALPLALLLLVLLHQVHGRVRPIQPHCATATTTAGPSFLLISDVRLCSHRWTPPPADGGTAPLTLVSLPLGVDLLADLLQVPKGNGVAGFHFGDLLLQLQHYGLVLLQSHTHTFPSLLITLALK